MYNKNFSLHDKISSLVTLPWKLYHFQQACNICVNMTV